MSSFEHVRKKHCLPFFQAYCVSGRVLRTARPWKEKVVRTLVMDPVNADWGQVGCGPPNNSPLLLALL